jgi:hypothetical protein
MAGHQRNTAVTTAAFVLLCGLSLAAARPQTASELFRGGSTQYVGIRYWLQAEDGSRLTEVKAQPGKQYSIHLRCNVGGFLIVFSTADGSELTDRTHPPYAGSVLQPGSEFRIPGTFRLTPDGASEELVFLFARSQTELVRTFDQALEKLARLTPALISETIAGGADLGTYVVNRNGAQPSAIIRVTR